jgi:hypothetical protein
MKHACCHAVNGKLRLVHDLQPLNRVTIRDAGLPPCMEDIIENLKGCSYYFVADLKSGYNAVPLKDGSRDLMAFHAYDLGSMRLTSHSMEITVYQPRILVEYCDLMTSISTVSQGFLFCCIFKISQPVS